MKHTFKYLTLLLLFTAALSSCEREDPNDQGNEGRLTEATLTFRVPGSNLPGTRALEEDNHDRDIKEVTVLVFQGGKYLYPRTGKITDYPTDQSSEIKFKVTLATGTYDLVILANAEAILTVCYPTGIPAETTKAAVASALEMTLGETSDNTGESDKWNTNTSTTAYHIPMWGELVDAIIPEDPTATITCTTKRELMRMVAKVDVTIDNIKVPISNFTLTEVHFFNYQRKGILIPDITKYTAKTPTLPATQLGLTGSDRGQKWGDGTAAIPDNQLTGEIFTFAAPAGADYTTQPCVIVGGKYNGSQKNTYYRIDFIDSNGKHLPLLRNYKYDIIVTKISGEGYVDVPTAYSSRPMNLKSQVMFWNESDMNDVVFDGVNFMSVSPGEFEISQLGVTTTDNHIITVATDVDVVDGKNWTATIYHDQEAKNEMTAENNQWLRLDKYYDNKVYDPNNPSTKSQIRLIADPSTDSDDRYAWIHFKAGRLVYVVKVTQLNYAPAYVWITDENGNSISSLTFSSENPVPKKFRVTWSPKSQPLQIERMPGADPFVYTDFPDDTSRWTEVPVQKAVDGSYEFTIKPTTYTVAQLKENPFKATSMTMRFITSDAMNNRKEAEINLRQMDYKIILGGFSDGYVGYEVAADVRANARWAMEVVDGGEFLQSPLTSTGPASITGADFKYQYRELGGKGSVTFRFSSPEGLFASQEVTVSLMPISHMFAKSNIVFKDGKLTFAETIEDNVDIPIPANSQGVFFKWGSLVALSTPCENYSEYNGSPFVASTDVMFIPNEEITIDTYADVPYYTPSSNHIESANRKYDYHIATYPRDYSRPGYYGGYDELNGVGDICRYISDKGWVKGRWRIPTGYEYYSVLRGETPIREGNRVGVVYGSFSYPEITDQYGLTSISSGVLVGNGVDYAIDEDGDGQNIAPNREDKIYFPASGYISENNGRGAMWHVGRYGEYHHSSWPNLSAFVGNNNFSQAEGNSIILSANTIRCIRDGSYSQ